MRIHTFGIGNECDKQLIKETASAGRGTSSFAASKEDDLSSLVITALRKSMVKSLTQCTFIIGSDKQYLGEVFKDQSICSYKIMSQEEFDNI